VVRWCTRSLSGGICGGFLLSGTGNCPRCSVWKPGSAGPEKLSSHASDRKKAIPERKPNTGLEDFLMHLIFLF